MAKIHRNGDAIIRLDSIVAAHIPERDNEIVEIIFTNRSFLFRCKTNEEAKEYLNAIQKEIEDSE